ncbi:hypothetical protein ABZO35_31975 [Burkholderia pseudomallei]|uniref:hypothetical protein n=1 Tax=Burkholderia pseudomallei TaxID=28450 RepID=UPI00345096A0
MGSTLATSFHIVETVLGTRLRCDRPYALFYLDPPYFETEGYGVASPFAEYEKIAERLRSIKGAGDRQPQ